MSVERVVLTAAAAVVMDMFETCIAGVFAVTGHRQCNTSQVCCNRLQHRSDSAPRRIAVAAGVVTQAAIALVST